jgi:hypothetical protein
VTLPLLIGEIPVALPESGGVRALLVFLAVPGVVEAVVEAVLGLILVELAYRLIDLDRSRAAVAAAGQTRSRPA